MSKSIIKMACAEPLVIAMSLAISWRSSSIGYITMMAEMAVILHVWIPQKKGDVYKMKFIASP